MNLDFDELNVLASVIYTEAVSGETSQESAIKKVTQNVTDILYLFAKDGQDSLARMLSYEAALDEEEVEDLIFLEIDGKTVADRVADHIRASDIGALGTLLESEAFRVYEGAKYLSAVHTESATGKAVFKTWDTMKDNKVRDTHSYLEGVSVPISEYFVTYDGDYALHPHGFKNAKNNSGCRCILTYSYNRTGKS
jgi:uncharacterized protein YuzE